MLEKSSINWGWGLFLSLVRFPLIILGNVAIIFAFRSAGFQGGTATGAEWATLSVSAANIICLGLLLWRARVENFRLGDLVGFQGRRFLSDVLWGVLWSSVLFALMVAGVMVIALAMQRMTGLGFEQIFMGGADFSFDPPQWVVVVMAINSAVVFPLLNALVEELQYRGYAQPRLIAATGSVWGGITIQALGFGLQHATFAFTLTAAPLYVAGFFLWGLGAGLIAQRQKRLTPLIVAHFISNLSFGIIPLYFMLGG